MHSLAANALLGSFVFFPVFIINYCIVYFSLLFNLIWSILLETFSRETFSNILASAFFGDIFETLSSNPTMPYSNKLLLLISNFIGAARGEDKGNVPHMEKIVVEKGCYF